MPQLDTATFPPQLIWLAITFVLLFVLMATVALPPVTRTLARRRGQIDGDLDRAARLRAEIDMVAHAYERALSEARAEAAAIVNATREEMAKLAAERQRETMAAIHEQAKSAEARIERARQATLGDLRGVAIDAARAATLRLIGETPNDGRLGTVVDTILKTHRV